jgi:hypothetical protein
MSNKIQSPKERASKNIHKRYYPKKKNYAITQLHFKVKLLHHSISLGMQVYLSILTDAVQERRAVNTRSTAAVVSISQLSAQRTD